MFDRDSYPGIYILGLVNDKIIDRAQVFAVIRLWFEWQYAEVKEGNAIDERMYQTLQEAYCLIQFRMKYLGINHKSDANDIAMVNWLADQFDNQTKLIQQYGSYYRQSLIDDGKNIHEIAESVLLRIALLQRLLFQCVCRAEQKHQSQSFVRYCKNMLKDFLQGKLHPSESIDLGMAFRAVYYNEANDTWNNDANRYLCTIGKQLRKIQRTKKESVRSNRCIDQLKYDLKTLLGCLFFPNQEPFSFYNKRDEYNVLQRRIDAWLKSQGIH